jgi:hypothetical protein
LLPTTTSTPVLGGRANGGADQRDRGVGFDTPRGRFSISPTGFQLGGSERPIASVGGVVAGVLITLAVLAAFAAITGGAAVLRSVRRTRRAPRVPSRIAHVRPRAHPRIVSTRSVPRPRPSPPSGRTRQQLYSEARRQNIRGRSSMNKAELERALRQQRATR